MRAKTKINVYLILIWLFSLLLFVPDSKANQCIDTFDKLVSPTLQSPVSPLIMRTKSFYNRVNDLLESEQKRPKKLWEMKSSTNNRILAHLANMSVPEALPFFRQSLSVMNSRIRLLKQEASNPFSLYKKAGIDIYIVINQLKAERALAQGILSRGEVTYQEWTEFSYRLSSMVSFENSKNLRIYYGELIQKPLSELSKFDEDQIVSNLPEVFARQLRDLEYTKRGVFKQKIRFFLDSEYFPLLPFFTINPPSIKSTNWSYALGIGYATINPGMISYHGQTNFSYGYLEHDLGHIHFIGSHNPFIPASKSSKKQQIPLNVVPDNWILKDIFSMRKKIISEQIYFRNYLFRKISSLSQRKQKIAHICIFYVTHEDGAILQPNNIILELQKNRKIAVDAIYETSIDPRESFYKEFENIPVSRRIELIEEVMSVLVDASVRYRGHIN
ncbi:MAG: hypothetical protein KDD50_10295 [Bdellovibrionales bacterium]|nr:hypothetical protein [Bdellovibrionales bacterium]